MKNVIDLDREEMDYELFNKIWSSNNVVIKYKNKLYRVVEKEEWQTICIEYFLEKYRYEIDSEDEDYIEDVYWETLFEAIEEIKNNEGYDEVLYVPPEISNVVWGVTFYLRYLG